MRSARAQQQQRKRAARVSERGTHLAGKGFEHVRLLRGVVRRKQHAKHLALRARARFARILGARRKAHVLLRDAGCSSAARQARVEATQKRLCAAYRHRRVEVEAARCAHAAEQLCGRSLRLRRARQRVRHAASRAEAAGGHRVRRRSLGRPRVHHAGAAARDEAQARRRRRRRAAAAPLKAKPPASSRGQPQQPHAAPPRS